MGIALVGQVVAGDPLAQLGTAQLTIGIHQFGDQADLQLIELGLGSFGLRFAGLQAALDTAEQVQLPGHVQAQIVTLGVHPLFAETGLLGLADIGARTCGDGGQTIIADIIANSPRRTQTGIGDTQLAVFSQCFADQGIQCRVLELLPPGRLEARAVVIAALGLKQPRRLRLRRAVIRADGATGDGQGEQGKGEELHARASLNTALRASRFSTKARITR